MEIKEHSDPVTDREKPPHHKYRVHIDGETVEIETQYPTGEQLLGMVGKRSCAFELIEELQHHENDVVEPDETVDLEKRGLKGFITAHKEVVTIFINGNPYSIDRGKCTVAEILAKVGETADGYVLLEERTGPPLPVPPNQPVNVFGCEIFHSQVQSGGSS